MLTMYPIPCCSCRLASNVRVYADCTVLEKPVEDGCDDNYKNNYKLKITIALTMKMKMLMMKRKPVEDGGGG